MSSEPSEQDKPSYYRLDEVTYAIALAFNMTAPEIAAGFGWWRFQAAS